MNLVDSCGWLEYFADGPNASRFEALLHDLDSLLVSAVSIYEVYKVLLRERGESTALQGIAAMHRAQVVDITPELAILAARLSLELKLPMADSLILATAKYHEATLWTQDVDFKGIEGVKYLPGY